MEQTEKQDKEIICADCNQPFNFPVREQEFFEQKDFQPPKRCFNCRKNRRKQQYGKR